MKKYLAVFVAPIESYDKMKEEMKKKTPEQRQAEMESWKTWMEQHKTDIADPGAPVGSAKRVSKDGITDVRNEIGGYMIIRPKVWKRRRKSLTTARTSVFRMAVSK